MIKDFKRELKLFDLNDNINERLMVIALYNEFYNDVLSQTEEEFIENTAQFMDKAFDVVIASLTLQDNKSINAAHFMKVYFQFLKRNILPGMSKVKGIIKIHESSLNSFIEESDYVNVIEKYSSIPFDKKVSIMVQFREYINNMFLAITNMYGEENGKELRNRLYDMLSIKLDEYLKDSLDKGLNLDDIANNLNPTLVVTTKNYLMNQLRNGNDSLTNFIDVYFEEYLSNYNEIEQKIWVFAVIYYIAGYDKNDRSKNYEKAKEISEFLGISKMKYLKTEISMGIKFIKLMKKAMNEPEIETLNDDSLVK